MSPLLLDPHSLPELVDLRAWLAASEPRQRAVLQAVARALGQDFEVVYGDPDPRTRAGADVVSFADVSLQGGLRVEHVPSRTLMCFVPGGTTAIGMSDQELAVFDDPDLLDAPRPPDPGDLRLLQSAVPFMRGAHGNTVQRTVAPFLMAEAPLSVEALERLGLSPLTDSSGEIERVGFTSAASMRKMQAPMRLPTEAEWEHACRAGSRLPFPFGDMPPATLGDPMHPLGLAALGHFPEAMSDAWRRHLEAGIAAPVPGLAEQTVDPEALSALGVVRGGAALHLPWRPGAGGWLRLLCAWRATWFREREAAACRPVVSVPCPPPPEAEPPRRATPIWRVARQTNELIGQLLTAEPAAREAARLALQARTSGFGIWTGQAAIALPWLVELAMQEPVPDRHRLLVLIADLVAGEHAATSLTGLDRTLPWVAEVASTPAARALRQALLERTARLATLATDIDPRLRAAVPLVITLLPEAEAIARAPLEAALDCETVPTVIASQLLGLGRLDRYARRPARRAHFAVSSPLVAGIARLAALAADARVLADDDGPIAPEHAAALAALLLEDVERDVFPWHEARIAALFTRHLSDGLPDGGIIAGLMLARLVREAGLGMDPHLATWAEGAVRVALGGANRRRIEALDARQWQIIADLSRRDFPELAPAWRAAGLPAEMGERRTLAVRHRGRL